jgi:hypothetical protein
MASEREILQDTTGPANTQYITPTIDTNALGGYDKLLIKLIAVGGAMPTVNVQLQDDDGNGVAVIPTIVALTTQYILWGMVVSGVVFTTLAGAVAGPLPTKLQLLIPPMGVGISMRVKITGQRG